MKLIEKKQVKDLLESAAKKFKVYAPQKFVGGDVMWSSLPKEEAELKTALANLALGDEDTVISPKDTFFPQLETLFKFKQGVIEDSCESSAKLIFGVKPCDLKGIIFVDQFFKRNFEDKYYLTRAYQRVIVAIGCLKPPRPKSCFCTSAKTGPFTQAGFDLQLVDVGDCYLVEVGSAKGKDFINQHNAFFKEAASDLADKLSTVKEKAASAVEVKVDFDQALTLMTAEVAAFDENYQRIAERCIYCGACLYTCPTCTCFNVYDNAVEDKGQRLRCWDGCVFEGYTREASGHNPRQNKALRTARRYEHKLKYDYQTTDSSGCVGCGRCLSSCPVNIGMSKFIQEITEKRKVL